MTQAETIVKQLEIWSEAYYCGDQQVDDATFDALEEMLFNIDPGNSWFTHNREKPFKYGKKITHRYEFIGSIDKIHSVAESKVLNTPYPFASAKLDGTSLVVYFKSGKVLNAVTRGNGDVGVDVTPHYEAITKKYKVTIPAGFTGAIRGEVVFSNDNWAKFKVIHPEAKLARNSGTGLLNQKTVQPETELLDYVVYDVIASNLPIEPNLEMMWSFLDSFGYKVAPHTIVSPFSDDVVMKSLYSQWSRTYPCDGLVLREQPNAIIQDKVNGIAVYRMPKAQEAYKFMSELKVCEVTGITWQLGMTGKLTPVLQIEPVEMSGAIVTNITAHNAERVRVDKLGVGAIITAQRSGDVIPKLESVVTPAASVEIPQLCPCCSSPLVISKTGIDLYCENPDCEEVKKLKVFNYIKYVCEGVKGIGDKFLSAFIAELDAYSIADLLIAAGIKHGNSFTTLGEANNKVAKQVLDCLNSKQVNVEKFLVGLGIELLGIEVAKKLAKKPAETSKLFEAIMALTGQDDKQQLIKVFQASLSAMPGQEALANNIVKNAYAVQEILSIIFFSDRSFVFNQQTQKIRYYAITGSLSKGRKEIEAEFSAKGWQMKDTLNGDTEVLICNDQSTTSSKYVKAKHLGKPIVTEEEFRKQYLGE